MIQQSTITLELDDIQRGALHPRPSPYTGAYFLLCVNDRKDGRTFLQRLIPFVASATPDANAAAQAWISAAVTFQGLKALGVPSASLDSFPIEFQEGMSARAEKIGDTGENAPEHWEAPLGSPDVHIVITVLATDTEQLATLENRARSAMQALPGVEIIWRHDVYALPNERTSLGFKDGISQPAVEGSGIPGTNPHEVPLKPGEFIFGYEDETGGVSVAPEPRELGLNGTFLVFRKLQTRVGAFRQYIRARARSREEEELMAAKFVGRWRSGAPLALAPEKDDPELGADPARNNAFNYAADDARGLKCPVGAHARRMNARDATVVGEVRLHRMIRRGTSYGPMLPDGELEDDGADRGIIFAFMGAHLDRQFEFVKSEWMNKGVFMGAPAEMDPVVGPNDGTSQFTIPRQPIRQRLQDVPRFVVNRGGEYCFVPGLRALRWISELDA